MDAHENTVDWPTFLEGFSRNQHYMYGYVTSEASLQQLLEVYKRTNTTTFCTRTSTTMQWTPTEKYSLRSIMFSKSSGPRVQWDGVPFVLGGRKILECQFGPGREHKKKSEKGESETLSEGHDYEPTNKRRQITTKKGCEAKLVIKQIYRFPQYKMDCDKYQSTECSAIKLRLLEDLKEETKDVTREERYYVELPLDDAHTNHNQEGYSDTAQTIHPQLTVWIEELVEEGVTDSMEIQATLKRYVSDRMSDPAVPSKSDLAYYPKLKDIKNHIVCQTRKVKQRLTKMDQVNLSRKLGHWRKDGAKQYFRPYRRASSTGQMNTRDIRQPSAVEQSDSSSPSDEKTTVADDEVYEESLLFVHQEKWQQVAMTHHGNAICLLDTTHKNINYDLALYFVCALTNGGYVVVATFIVQREQVAYVREALNMLKVWNPYWKPHFWMTSDGEAECGALRGAFPSSSLYLCDFYREQAWTRWIQDAKHGLSAEEGGQLIRLLRNVAAAPPGPTEDQTHYRTSVGELKSSALWEKPHVRAWLEAKWLCSPEKWARAYRDSVYHLAVDTNNGVESLNTFLKHSFLKKTNRDKKTISGFVDALINRYLPARRQEYMFSQYSRSDEYRRCHPQVPQCSEQNIPAATAKLCLVNMGKAEEIGESSVRPVDIEQGVFKVKDSREPVPWCTVDFGTTTSSPSCSCRAYVQTRVPCKHFFAVFLHHPEWSWNRLPSSYLKGPYLTGKCESEPAHKDEHNTS